MYNLSQVHEGKPACDLGLCLGCLQGFGHILELFGKERSRSDMGLRKEDGGNCSSSAQRRESEQVISYPRSKIWLPGKSADQLCFPFHRKYGQRQEAHHGAQSREDGEVPGVGMGWPAFPPSCPAQHQASHGIQVSACSSREWINQLWMELKATEATPAPGNITRKRPKSDRSLNMNL